MSPISPGLAFSWTSSLSVGRARPSLAARLTSGRYGLGSIFFRSVPPPTVHLHLHLHSDLTSGQEIPSLVTPPKPEGETDDGGLATPEEARLFELWLRSIWTAKEKRMEGFYKEGRFVSGDGGEDAREVVKIRQVYVSSPVESLVPSKGEGRPRQEEEGKQS